MQRLITRNHLNLLTFSQRLLLFSTSSTSSSSPSTSCLTTGECFTSYAVDSLGFSRQQALSLSSKLYQCKNVNHLSFQANANSVLAFFRTHGFDDTHISKIVSVEPRLLTCNVDNTLLPKFKFLQDQGFKNSDLIRVISVNPGILRHGIETSILPLLGILRQFLGCDTLVIVVLKRLSPVNYRGIINNMMPNVDFLISYGTPIKYVTTYILLHPNDFSRNPNKFKERVISVENQLGIARDAPMFVWGIHLLTTNREKAIQSKCQIFKSFGWTQTDIYTFMMKMPTCFALSEATIKKKLDFLMNKLQLKPGYLITHTAFFIGSLEKRIMPRHKVLLILKEKGLLLKNPSLYTSICMTEICFLDNFVKPFKEVHQVYAKLTGCSMKTPTQLDCKFQESLALPII